MLYNIARSTHIDMIWYDRLIKKFTNIKILIIKKTKKILNKIFKEVVKPTQKKKRVTIRLKNNILLI